MNENLIVSLKDIVVEFDGEKVLDGLSLDIHDKEFVTFLGPSGCGKTTTLRVIAGFITPKSGNVFFDGEDIADLPPYKRQVNTVFQKYALFPHLNVFENVAFALRLKKLPEEEIKSKVLRMLEIVGLKGYERRNTNQLSGGQQQRVAIARSLINQPRVLLLDEPLGALDLKLRKQMQLELKRLQRELNITFIYVTHDQEEALTMSDKIVVMNEGKIQQIGTPTDIYNEPVNSFVADFIGESNILNGTMVHDRKVNFIGHDFECVDEGFGENNPVDVVIRPEDVYLGYELEGAQFSGTVKSCVFKGVHYEMYVETDSGNELQIQDYDAFEPGRTVQMLIHPDDIQGMKKERVENVIDCKVIDETHIEMFGEEFECAPISGNVESGTPAKARIQFSKVDLMDHEEEGNASGEVWFILYKGNHYHLTVKTESGEYVYVDTDDIWDKGDLVGISIQPGEIIVEAEDEQKK